MSKVTSMTVSELKAFLQARQKKTTGNKASLVRLALLYENDPVVQPPQASPPPKENVFLDTSPQWHQVSSSNSQSAFKLPLLEITTIASYLTKMTMPVESSMNTRFSPGHHSFEQEDLDEEVECGTRKPVVKGRQLYLSEKIFFLEEASGSRGTLFRANVEASMKKKIT
jgi:hypothetical protein